MIFQIPAGEPSFASQVLFEIYGFPITNTIVSGLLTSLILFFIASQTFKYLNKNDKYSNIQIFIELIIEAVVGFIEKVVGDRKIGYKIAPLIGTLILYIGISDILPLLLPGSSSIQFNGVNVIRTHTNDYSTTLGLAIGIITITHIIGIHQNGFIQHMNQFVPILTIIDNFKLGIGKGLMSIIDLFVGVLNIIGEAGKLLSMSLRLFGNMFAGDLLMTIFFSLFAIILPVGWTMMSLFSGIIQALVFGALSASFCAASFKKED